MSMTSVMTDEDRTAHAKRALVTFKTMIATVYEPLLRAVTRNPKLRVQPSAKISATDGKTVWLMTPWVLGETREHDKSRCNRRDPASFKMLCPACEQRDAIDGTVFHESAHITSDSFAEVDVDRTIDLTREHLPFVDTASLSVPRYYKGEPVRFGPVFKAIEPVYLPVVFNAVEDTYVNRRLFHHRPGVEKSMQVMTIEVFEQGFRQGDGSHVEWSKQPLDAQAIMVAYLLGARLPHLIQHLADEVQVVKDDPIIVKAMEEIPTAGTIEDRFETTFVVLNRLRELGFCIPPSQKQPEPQGDESEDGEESEQGQEGDEGDEPSPPGGTSGSTKGEESSNEDEDAETEGQDGDESKDDESDDKGQAGLGTEGEDKEGDDSEPGEGAGSDDDASEDDDADESEGSGSGQGQDNETEDDDAEDEPRKGDFEGGDDEGDDDQDMPSGSGDAQDDDDESYDDSEGDSGEGPTPEELDQQAAEEMERFSRQMMGHDDEDKDPGDYTEPEDNLKPHAPPTDGDTKSIDDAIKWEKFDAPPGGIADFYEQEPDVAETKRYYDAVEVDPGLISGETARLRSVFAANRKRRLSGSLKSGPKLDVPHLHRIGQEDYRIFGRNDRPDKRDWFVLVGLDDSGSTHSNGAAEVIREMALSVGEMLNGVGVKFAMYGHGGTGDGFHVTSAWKVRHLIVKGPDEPWTQECKDRVLALGRDNTCNYDGHTLEQYRKIITKRRETDKMIMYFTDGAMPMMNYDEELEVLQRELKILRQSRVNLFGVGYQTDSPKQHGMDTLVIQNGRDLPGLIDGLRSRLEV